MIPIGAEVSYLRLPVSERFTSLSLTQNTRFFRRLSINLLELSETMWL